MVTRCQDIGSSTCIDLAKAPQVYLSLSFMEAKSQVIVQVKFAGSDLSWPVMVYLSFTGFFSPPYGSWRYDVLEICSCMLSLFSLCSFSLPLILTLTFGRCTFCGVSEDVPVGQWLAILRCASSCTISLRLWMWHWTENGGILAMLIHHVYEWSQEVPFLMASMACSRNIRRRT